MRKKKLANIVVFGILFVLGGSSYVLLQPRIHTAPAATDDPERLILHGVARDFRASHPDFDVVPDLGYGHYAGNVALDLAANERPVFNGVPNGGGGDPEDELATIGYDTYYAATQGDVKKTQIATRITLPFNATLMSITALVGNKDKEVRYALYADDAGEPGSRMVQTSSDESDKDDMEWLTLGVPETPLAAGDYWLALALEDDDQQYAYEPSGGTTREVEHDAAEDGFTATWDASDSSSSRRVAIYGMFQRDADAQDGGSGFKVETEWFDAQGRPIAPHMFGAGAGGDDPIDFEIVDQAVIPSEPFAVQITVLGAAIQTGSDGYHRPVTMQTHIGDFDTYEPFGLFETAVAGNLNDDQAVTGDANCCNPRREVIAEIYSPMTPISITARSWKLIDPDAGGTDESNWEPKMTASTLDVGPQVMVLRNGDPIPDIDGLYDQDSIAEYVSNYVNMDTGTMSLGVNEIIYLFEVGESGDSSSADFQDLVVVVTLGSDPGDFPVTPTLCGIPLQDLAGAAGAPSSGGITSPESFNQWYRDALGTNLSRTHSITLVRNADGVYEYLDDAFHPNDGRLFGNEGQDHNFFFTYAIKGSFRYESCAGQFFEFEGSDDAWLFVDRKLVLDVGGVQPWTSQFLAVDRLGLEDGERYDLHFFYAQRQTSEAEFRLRTNMQLGTARTPNVITGGYD